MRKILNILFMKNKFKWFLFQRGIKFQIMNLDNFKKENDFFKKEYKFSDKYMYLRHYTSLDATKSIISDESIYGSNYSEKEMENYCQGLRSEVHFIPNYAIENS